MRNAPRSLAALACLVLLLIRPASADTRADLVAAMQRGQYEDVIAHTTELINATDQPDPDYVLLRGMAAFHIAWFGQAEADLASLPADRFPAAAETRQRIARARELAPANMREIKARGDVIFRVYFDTSDKWTGALMNALPAVYNTDTGFYGVNMMETAVFVFADKDRHAAFTEALTGQPPPSWAWASGGNGMLVFCPYAPGNNYRESPDQLPETLAHEFSHCLTHRVLGTAAMPLWLDEGLAMYCSGLVRPQKTDDNDIYITRMWTTNAILPLRVVTNKDTFYDEGIAANAYVEAYAMVRFLIAQTGRDGLLQLLNGLRENGQFGTVMGQFWKGGLDGFYQDWLAATQQRVQKFK